MFYLSDLVESTIKAAMQQVCMNGTRGNIHIRQQRHTISTQTTIFTGFQINATEIIYIYRNFGEPAKLISTIIDTLREYIFPRTAQLSQSLTEWDVSLIVDQNVKERWKLL